MTGNKLKPCPFCGGVADLVFKIPVYGTGGCEIKCTMCKGRMNDFRYTETHLTANSISTPYTIDSITGCIKRTIEAWNRRGPNDKHRP